jgi:hypothetical protein
MTDDERFSHEAISRMTPVEPSAQLRRLVAQIPLQHPREERSFWPFGNLWAPSFALAAAGLLGLFVGSWDTWTNAPMTSLASDESNSVSDEITNPALEDENLDDLIMMATSAHFRPDEWDLFTTSTHGDHVEEPF